MPGGVSGLDACLTVFQHQCPRRGGAQLLAGNEEDIRRGLAAALGQVRAEHKGVKTTADAVLVQDAVGPGLRCWKRPVQFYSHALLNR